MGDWITEFEKSWPDWRWLMRSHNFEDGRKGYFVHLMPPGFDDPMKRPELRSHKAYGDTMWAAFSVAYQSMCQPKPRMVQCPPEQKVAGTDTPTLIKSLENARKVLSGNEVYIRRGIDHMKRRLGREYPASVLVEQTVKLVELYKSELERRGVPVPPPPPVDAVRNALEAPLGGSRP